MKEIKMEFDYLHGPLWKDKLNPKTGQWSTGVPCIDNDKAIQLLNDEAEKMYESLYSFENGYKFDDNKFNQMKGQLLSLVQTIISRLSSINDGSFVVIDNVTKTLL